MKLSTMFSDKRVRYGGYSVVMTVVVLAILVTLNLVVAQLDIKWDFSGNQMNSITKETIEVVQGLDQEVTLYTLFRTGAVNDTYADILSQYAAHSAKIQIINRDPYLYPTFVAGYAKEGEDIPVNSVIVESGARSRVVSASDMIEYSFDYTTFQQTAEYLQIEPLVTNAIRYVASAELPKAYTLAGHDERGLPALGANQMALEGYEVEELNLIMGQTIPEDCDVLIITTLRRDITPDERALIEEYLVNGGHLMTMVDMSSVETPQFDTLLAGYGVQLSGALVIEGDTERTIQGQPYFCFPVIEDFEIGNPLTEKAYNVLIALSQAVTQTEVRKQSVKIYPLLTSSDKSYGKANAEAQTVEKEEGDLSGPLNLAVAVEDAANYENPTRLVVFGSSALLEEQINAAVSGANLDFFMNSLGWLTGQEQNVYIRAKSLKTEQLQLNGSQQLFLLLLSVILIPLALLVTGIVRWMRRRHK